jgi:hypothetical protein
VTPRRLLPLCAAALASCLLPQSVDPQSNRVRYPPRVVVEAIPPKLAAGAVRLSHGSIDLAQGCACRLTLSVPQLEENDPTADLEVRWFVDYDPGAPVLAQPSQLLRGSFDPNSVLRQGPSFDVEFGRPGITDGVHVVDVVIAEQGAFDDAAIGLPYRSLVTGYGSATVRFVVEVVTNNETACRADAPWKRVCP